MKVLIVLGMLLSLGLAGCGPEQTAADKNIAQKDLDLKEQQKKCEPFVGEYEGTFQVTSAKRPVTLYITKASISSPLQGTLFVQETDSNLGKRVLSPYLSFGYSECFPERGRLVLASSSLNATNSIELILVGNTFAGRLSTIHPSNGGLLSVSRLPMDAFSVAQRKCWAYFGNYSGSLKTSDGKSQSVLLSLEKTSKSAVAGRISLVDQNNVASTYLTFPFGTCNPETDVVDLQFAAKAGPQNLTLTLKNRKLSGKINSATLEVSLINEGR